MKSSIFKLSLRLVSVFIAFMPNVQLSNWGNPLGFTEAGSLKLSFLSQPAFAQEKQGVAKLSKTNKNCQQAINNVKKVLLKKGYFSPIKQAGGKIIKPQTKTDISFIKDNFYDFPQGRPQTVIFVLTDTEKNNISNFYDSRQLMANLSSEIISSCDQVGLVYFAYWIEEGYPVGYFSDQTVRTFILSKLSPGDCSDLAAYQKMITTPKGDLQTMKWGYHC